MSAHCSNLEAYSFSSQPQELSRSVFCMLSAYHRSPGDFKTHLSKAVSPTPTLWLNKCQTVSFALPQALREQQDDSAPLDALWPPYHLHHSARNRPLQCGPFVGAGHARHGTYGDMTYKNIPCALTIPSSDAYKILTARTEAFPLNSQTA